VCVLSFKKHYQMIRNETWWFYFSCRYKTKKWTENCSSMCINEVFRNFFVSYLHEKSMLHFLNPVKCIKVIWILNYFKIEYWLFCTWDFCLEELYVLDKNEKDSTLLEYVDSSTSFNICAQKIVSWYTCIFHSFFESIIYM
jgi:hypothetical protein